MSQAVTKQLNLLGLAMRAGFLVSGDELTQQAIKANQVDVVIVASDVSEKTKERYLHLCRTRQLPLVTSFSFDQLSQAIGRPRKLMAITNAGMAKKFISYKNGVTDMHD